MKKNKMTLQEAIKLSGVEGWTLTHSQKTFLLKSTEELLKKHSKEWFQENQGRLQAELEIVFKEI